ncbi:gliding motility-associated-like protein [Maribacter caenipelagi]|uniref:Gliding motility-associated-like protein n=1 Tax=Maribacter caenipelagi TaxID=1447781 RepID=A0A4R7DJS2_9FLAO|nr:T9SS type B sorting domain-containing protein [Maribacter caenipelagi]TDS20875.1 gliding motility-associated-like protein [Maribacter caenipelagi]
MNLRNFLVIFLLLISCFVNAQREAAIWYFGENAGLDFNSGSPLTLLDGALNTREGCATISDFNGNLLFYTDGITVWNRNHVPMPNGNGLLGDPSATQSAIIIPNPGDPNIYYIFTADKLKLENGINYNVVDISLNGGLGDVIQKNIQLVTPASEKLTAVTHANGTDVWVLTHDAFGDAYMAYLVTTAGVNPTPVISNLGIHLTTYFYEDDYHAIGYIKASPNGEKVAAAHAGLNVDVMDFDTATGVLTNAVAILDATEEYKGFFGIEFSPSSRFLYTNSSNFTELYQYDLEAVDIKNSVVSLNTTEITFGALQLGIDGKIYLTEYLRPTLSVIENPNEKGAASNLNYSSIDLGGRLGVLGLPPFITSYFLVNIDVDGFCAGNPTTFESSISATPVSTLWDFGDGNTSTLQNPSHTYTAAGDYTVSVTVTTASETKTETKDITIFETPIAVTQTDIEVCVAEDSYTLDLTTLNNAILGTLNPSDFTVTYFSSQNDADTNSNALALSYDFPLGSTAVYALVSNSSNTICFDTTQFNVIAQQEPTLETINNWTICDDDLDGFYTFDLTEKNTEIFNGQDETVFDVAYFASQADADTGSNPLPVNYTNTLPSEEIFVRLENSSHIDCYKTESFTIEVSSGVVANTPSNLEMCDDNNDGLATFSLSDTEAEIIGTQSSTSLAISYHTTMADAESGVNAIANIFTNTTAYNQSIFVRVENASDTSCYATTSFELQVFDSPQIQTVTDWNVCDNDNNGVAVFDLTQKNAEILGNQNVADFTVRYYENMVDADMAQNEIIGTFQNTANPQTIYYSIVNTSNANCIVTGSFSISVYNTPFAQAPSPIILCDVKETGVQTIDLTQKDVEILGSQDVSEYNVTYFASQTDAENNTNSFDSSTYSNVMNQETIYARVQPNNLDSCYATTSFEIIINSLPQPNLEERYVICPDSPALVIDGGDFESWSWQNSAGVELSTVRNFNVSELGEYLLRVSQTTNGVSCVNSQSFEVLSSGAPETMEVEVNGFSDQIDITINATGTGPFEYSVDGENYQASNEFKVFPGKHTVFVRDLEECRVLSEEILGIGYQRFFTPNGDGNNEYWNIIGGELYPESQLFIYDRYGKLLKQINSTSRGWDGLYNGVSLPESDYWFKYTYGNNEVITGHFTLKR